MDSYCFRNNKIFYNKKVLNLEPGECKIDKIPFYVTGGMLCLPSLSLINLNFIKLWIAPKAFLIDHILKITN